MRILFLTSDHLDYVSDPLYVGLSRVLGEGQVVEYPYKAGFHDVGLVPWYLVPSSGRPWTREEILDRLREKHFDLVCLASFRKECLDQCAELYRQVPFPPMVFIDGSDAPQIRYDVLARFPIAIYFKREYPCTVKRRLSRLLRVADLFRIRQHGTQRIVPMPMSLVLETIPTLSCRKQFDVSYTGRASHERRIRAFRILSAMSGPSFSGNIYASPGDRKYKLRAGSIKRLMTKIFNNSLVEETELIKKKSPYEYCKEIASSRIAVCIRGGGWLTPRYFEIPAMGTLLLCERPAIEIPDNFEHRKHAVFCKNDLSDLEDLVLHYLRENDERERIAEAGRKHFLKYHTCERRAEYFRDLCLKIA